MTEVNLLGPSMRKKAANKGIIDGSIITLGDNLQFTHSRGMQDTTPTTSVHNVPWGDVIEDVVTLNTVGYTGFLTVGEVTFQVVNGLITDVVTPG